MRPGLLTAQEIHQLAQDTAWVEPFVEEHLNGAAYELSVGMKALLVLPEEEGGYVNIFIPRQPDEILELEPGQTAVIYSYETVQMPLDIQGHLYLKASWATRGLYFPGGIVDPGYQGTLFFSVTNLARATIRIPFGAPLVKMELFRLSAPAERPYVTEPVRELPQHLRPPLPERTIYDPLEVSLRLDELQKRLAVLNRGDQTLDARAIQELAAKPRDKERPLIEPFEATNLKAISYDLRVGEKIVLALPTGIQQRFLEPGQAIELPPGASATVYSLETVNMPLNVKGHLSLRSKFISQRLNFDGGIVYPGYRGRLFFTVTNIGDRPIPLEYGERFVHLELVRLGKPVAQEHAMSEPALSIPKDRIPKELSDEWYTVQELSQHVRELRQKVHAFESTRAVVELFFLALVAGVIAGIVLANWPAQFRDNTEFGNGLVMAFLFFGVLWIISWLWPRQRK